MTTTVADDILSRLDLVVFERLPDGVFLQIAPARPPAWFSRLIMTTSPNGPVTLAQAFPFLERFLSDAERVWTGSRDRRLRSEPFTAIDRSGTEVPLTATAVAVEHRSFLVLEIPADFEERRRLLQTAREQLLVHEDHLRRTAALASPVEAARRLLRQLDAMPPGPEQQRVRAEIDTHLASLADAIHALAPGAKSVSRTRRGTE